MDRLLIVRRPVDAALVEHADVSLGFRVAVLGGRQPHGKRRLRIGPVVQREFAAALGAFQNGGAARPSGRYVNPAADGADLSGEEAIDDLELLRRAESLHRSAVIVSGSAWRLRTGGTHGRQQSDQLPPAAHSTID